MEPLDLQLLTPILLGALAGSLSGLVPGLHVNTVAALALMAQALAPAAPLAAGLLAALGASTIVTIVPMVTLGVPEGEGAPALLPGQRLARQGKTRLALEASLAGSLTGLIAATLLALPLYGLLTRPEASGLLSQAAPWVAAGALILLVLSDTAGPPAALLVAGLAGALGLVSLGLPVASPLGLSATVLLPLFLGLFALPALIDASQAPPATGTPPKPPGDAAEDGPGHAGSLLGTALGVLAGLFPGFTTGPATAVAYLVTRQDEAGAIATTSAVNTTVAVTATVALHSLGRTRTGVHVAQVALGLPGGTRHALLGDLEVLVAGALIACLLLPLLASRVSALARVVPRLALCLIPLWLALVLAFTGWPGLLVSAAGWATARSGHGLGCRRSLLMASLLVPTLARALVV